MRSSKPDATCTAALDGLVPDWGPQVRSGIGISALHRRGPDSIDFTSSAHITVILLTPQPSREISLGSSRRWVFDAPAGTLEVIPAGASFFGRWPVAKENLLFAYEPEKLAALALQEFSISNLELQPPKRGFVDEQATWLANLIRQELSTCATGDGLYIDALNMAFAIDLLRRHSNVSNSEINAPRKLRGGLSPIARRSLIEYIDDGVGQSLSIQELADLVGLSPGYFLRSFKQSFGETPHRYVMRRRLELAERLVIEGRLPLSQIAQVAGYSNQSHLTSEMKRRRGHTPSMLRRLARTTHIVSPLSLGREDFGQDGVRAHSTELRTALSPPADKLSARRANRAEDDD